MLLMTRDEIKLVWDDIQQRLHSNMHHLQHLYVPGRVIILFDEQYETSNNNNCTATAAAVPPPTTENDDTW
jgi:hypothetical protein